MKDGCIARYGRSLYEPGPCNTLLRKGLLSDKIRGMESSYPGLAEAAMLEVEKVRENTPRKIGGE